MLFDKQHCDICIKNSKNRNTPCTIQNKPKFNPELYIQDEKTMLFNCIYKKEEIDFSMELKINIILKALFFRDMNGKINVNSVIEYFKIYFNEVEFEIFFDCLFEVEQIINKKK